MIGQLSAKWRSDPLRRGSAWRVTLVDLMANPGELSVSCLDCHHNTTMPVAALLPCYAAETPFPDVWGGLRCSACGSRSAVTTFSPSWTAYQADRGQHFSVIVDGVSD